MKVTAIALGILIPSLVLAGAAYLLVLASYCLRWQKLRRSLPQEEAKP